MKATFRMIAIAMVLVYEPVDSGAIRRWVDEDGTLTFGDAPPPEARDIETIRHPAPVTGIQGGNYYTPQNQLQRMQAERRRTRNARRDAAFEDERLRLRLLEQRRSEDRKRTVRVQECARTRARLREQEHAGIQPYRREAERLRDESRLAWLRKQETEHCD